MTDIEVEPWEYETVAAIYGELERIPAPPDAVDDIGDWDYDENPPADTYSRLFDVKKWTIPVPDRYSAEIAIGALQIANVVKKDGGWHVESWRIDKWEMHVQTPDILTTGRARQLAAALLEAADELEARGEADA
jgi:hypothetical protein